MSNGEVKRFMAIVENPIFAYDDVRRLCVLESDHDRIVAELKAEVEYLKASRERLALCELEALKRVEEKRQTIAKQAKVIEKLKTMVSHYEDCKKLDAAMYEDDDDIPCDCGIEKEIAAIENLK